MKTFKYQFSLLIRILIFVALALCIVGFGINLYQVIVVGLNDSYNIYYTLIRYILMFAVTITLFAILVSLLISSFYSIEDKTLKTHFGFIVSKYDIESIDSITLDRANNKLNVIFSQTQMLSIVIKEQSYDDFIEVLLACKPTIDYEIISLTNDDKKDKK
jgi:hypothetical protein